MSETEILRYVHVKQLGPDAVKNSLTTTVDVHVPYFWASVAEGVPAFAACARW